MKTQFYKGALQASKMLFLTRKNKIHIFNYKPTCNVLLSYGQTEPRYTKMYQLISLILILSQCKHSNFQSLQERAF